MYSNIAPIILTHFLLLIIAITIFIVLKKRNRSAKSIYKLIDKLEKKYIY